VTMLRGAVVASGETTRLADDLEFAAQIGLQLVRLDVPWTLAQPRQGAADGAVFEKLLTAAATARGLGLAPWFRLLQPDVPHWFDDEGAFGDDRAAGTWWPRWVELVAERLGDVAAGWVPFEAPVAMATRLEPDDPRRHDELTTRLFVAWRDAWRILRGGPPVATSLDVAGGVHADAWLGALADGELRLPDRADRPIADLAGACDIVGIAVRADVESWLYRTAEIGPPRPISVVFGAQGATDTERAGAITAMWRDVRRAEGELELVSVTAASLLDAPGRHGLATADRRLTDAGEAFLSG
jgi:hypothetical protein